MTLPDIREIVYGEGDYADPVLITKLGRILKNANSRAAAASLVISGNPSLLLGFTVSSTATQFLQIFDASAVPADTTVPLLVFALTAGAPLPVEWLSPRSFQNGIVMCNSSTQHTKTIGSANCIFDVQYI
jgi:hypothetical protein